MLFFKKEENRMKRLLVLLLVFPLVVMAEGRVVQDSAGYHVVEEQQKDVGIIVETGLDLSSEQLARIIDKKESVPIDVQTKSASWDRYLVHIEYENVSTLQAVLDGVIVKKVHETVTERVVIFNPFFIFALFYIVCMIIVYRRIGNTSIATVAVAAAAAIAAAAAAIAAAAVAIAAIAAAIAAIAAVIAAIAAAVVYRDAVIVGIVLMITSSALMYFFI